MHRVIGFVLAAALGLPAEAAFAADARTPWRVSVTNLTPPGSQPFTPPLLAVHAPRADVWSVGRKAGRGVALIAEDGDTSVLESELAETRGVRRVSVGDSAIPPGATRRYRVTSAGAFNRLSMVWMLVNTNDGFSGTDALRLNRRRSVEVLAYDAGSERNNESVDFVPGPCCNAHGARDPESRAIRPHPGVRGVGDIDPTRYGWTGAVARIKVRRAQ